MVSKPIFLMIWIAIKPLKRYLVISLLAGILDFKMAVIFNIFWPIFQLLSSLGDQNGGNTYVYDAKGCNKSTCKVTGYCFLGGHLKFQNGCHINFKMATIFNILEYISASEPRGGTDLERGYGDVPRS